MKVIPTGRRVLVQRDAVSDTYEDSIIARVESSKDTDQRRASFGTVLAIADEAYLDVFKKKQCGVGDRVIFRAYAGVSADPDDLNTILLNDQDILGVIVDE